ncbi:MULTISPECIES: HK97 family phage prohead protease [Bifidobacterium]|uniref:HK97 family phage prohead protease n=1 Tax=Bifidobacterium tibiigranuli TaxID=2172043 RepID=A0A5N6S724_9BIFI|nr:HK97 family phage prohead protease [Bifidobacterium tibiigranuli]KAE8130219.1 HK97 family phage prohead protease [Bifidobacterium tibiigranuli]KAE8130422.1 HK97 family phage prohead protease [Bifidobacterium tibiigranuli]
MDMKHLTFKTDFKTADANDDKGEFDALVSVFGVTDSQSEVVDKGAFDGALNRLQAKGGAMPILWSHQWNDMKSVLGSAQAEQTDTGLLVHATLDMTNPESVRALHLMKSGLVNEFSIGGMVPRGTAVTKSEGGRIVRHLKEFDLVEVSLVLKGANPATRLIDVKSAADDEDASHSLAENLKSIHQQLGDAIEEAEAHPAGGTETPPPSDDGNTDEATRKTAAATISRRRATALLALQAELARPEGSRA